MLEHANIQTGFMEINGAQIYYEMTGSGTPLVLVHAGIADRRMWDEQFHAFAQEYQVVRYDLRGYGKTAPMAGAFSHRQDLYELLKVLHIPHAYFVGCSKGGSTLIDFALEHPEMVKALVLVACTPHGYEFQGEPPTQWDAMVAAFKQGDMELAAELEVQIWVDGPHRTPSQVDPTVRRRVREMNLIALTNEAAQLGTEQPLEPAAIQRMNEIRVPALIVVGDLDDLNIVAGSQFLERSIMGSRRVVFSQAAHFPNMEQPEKFNQDVLEFFHQQ